jgi:hypothetical protein
MRKEDGPMQLRHPTPSSASSRNTWPLTEGKRHLAAKRRKRLKKDGDMADVSFFALLCLFAAIPHSHFHPAR